MRKVLQKSWGILAGGMLKRARQKSHPVVNEKHANSCITVNHCVVTLIIATHGNVREKKVFSFFCLEGNIKLTAVIYERG